MRTNTSGATSLRPRRRLALAVVSLALLPLLTLTVFASHLLAQTAHASGSVSFAPAVAYEVGAGPLSMAIGDLNGDGHPDLVTTNGSNLMSVLLGNGTGGFLNGGSDPVIGTDPVAVASGNLNGNGQADLVTANFGSNDVGVLMDGSSGGVSYPVSVGPDAVAIGDLNGDGHPDLAVANQSSNNVTVLLGNSNGDGTFTSSANYAVGAGPVSVAIGDLNGDGHPDLAVANAVESDISVLLGSSTGDGTFAAAVNYGVSAGSVSVAIGDLNGDGHPDLVTSGSNNASVLLGSSTGNGTFAAAVNYGVGTSADSVAIGDLNGDGHPDLVTADAGNNGVSVLLGDGLGSFGAAVTYPTGTTPFSVAIVDLNSDGHTDLVTANSGSNDVSVLLNTTTSGTPTPTPTVSPTPGGGGGSNTSQVTLALAAGELSATTNAAPSLSATLNGQDQTLNYSLPITVTDGTATGNGWNLTITSTQFSTGGPPVTTLPTTASTAVSVAAVCASGSCVNPTNTVSYPITIPAGTIAPAPVKLFNATVGTGVGIFTVTPSVNILVPAATIAGTYTSTITLAIVSGP